MNPRAKCCLCPWQTKAISLWAVLRIASHHQAHTGHSRIKIKEK